MRDSGVGQLTVQEDVLEEIRRLKREKNAIILAHHYQVPEVQGVADVIGDSLGLSRAAAKTEADLMIFCGVNFMAETAAILSPHKKVVIPDPDAGCSLASSVDAVSLRSWKEKHPDALVVSYVNTSAEVKAESDYCCTSANAVDLIRSLPQDREILFLPDMFLGAYVSRVTGRTMHLWQGECHVHVGITPSDVARMRAEKPDAELLAHPECGCVSSTLYYASDGTIPSHNMHVLSTDGMIKHARLSPSHEFIVATEVGILHRLRRENPGKQFYATNDEASCVYMKKITLPKVLRSLQEEVYEVRVPEAVADRARTAIERMLATV